MVSIEVSSQTASIYLVFTLLKSILNIKLYCNLYILLYSVRSVLCDWEPGLLCFHPLCAAVLFIPR